ncbi:MAG: sulfatase-like hydrolase/transferase [Rikenellaceae bacterium]
MKNLFTPIPLLAVVPMVASTSCQGEAKEAAQPNILVILCDDLGNGELSIYGHPVIKTPNLDQMANDGIMLTNCYSASPVSSPSRAGLLTGRSPNRAGFYDFIPGPKRSEDCRELVHLQEYEQTIPAMLKEVGYSTCLSGKWHCSSYFASDKQPNPDHFGFDHWFATHNNSAPSHENPTNFVRNGEKAGNLTGFSCELVVDEALGWLSTREKNNETNPFYLQVCFHEPHEPIASPKEITAEYMDKSINEYQAEYYANVVNMDKQVGRLIEYLESNGYENTIVYFSSDNGPETLNRYSRAIRSYGTTGGLKGMKLWTTDGGFHVPGIIYPIGMEMHKGQSDAIISSLDLMPTFAELAGATLPDVILDGESFVSLLKTGDKERVKPLTWAFYDALNDHVVATRTEEWKILARLKNGEEYLPKLHNIYDGNIDYIKSFELTDFELYHIAQDRNETTEVSAKYPAEFEKMKALINKQYGELLEGSHVWSRNE